MGKLQTKIEVFERRSGGVGQIQIEHLKDASLESIKMYAKITVFPHNSIGLHQHIEDTETYTIISGQGIYTDENFEYPVKSGDCLFCGKNQSHAIANPFDEDLVFFALITKN